MTLEDSAKNSSPLESADHDSSPQQKGNPRQEIFLPSPRALSQAATNCSALFFHGLTGTPHEMEELASMANSLGVCALVPCLSGHSHSIAEMKLITDSQWLEDTEEARQRVLSLGKSKIFVCGLSFGSLLALNLAVNHPKDIAGIVLLSPPLSFRSQAREIVLPLLALLPDFVLNKLGVVEKTSREPGVFVKQRHSFKQHSLGAAARLIRLRNRALRQMAKINCPVLLLVDPGDHHIASDVPQRLQRLLKPELLTIKQFPGGQHELPLGPKNKEVTQAVKEFFVAILSDNGGR